MKRKMLCQQPNCHELSTFIEYPFDPQFELVMGGCYVQSCRLRQLLRNGYSLTDYSELTDSLRIEP